MNTRKADKPLAIRVHARCSFCRQEIDYPAKFNALVFCPNRNVRAQGVPAKLERYVHNSRHELVAAAELQRARPRFGILARVRAALASAFHVFKAGSK